MLKQKQSPKKVFGCYSYLTSHFQLHIDILAPTQQAKVKNTIETKAKIEEVINLTTKKSIAGQHISTMSTSEREDVVNKLSKTAKTNKNKHVKATVLAVAYDNLCQSAFLEHLQGLQGPVSHMVHPKRRTLAEKHGLFAQIKVGDWVEVEPEYSPGMCSDGGVGCVLGCVA
jgi:hypothetical protein